MHRLLLVAVLLAASCAALPPGPRLPFNHTCQDGAPIKILQHPDCQRGICGYTCAPDRWRLDRKES